MRRVLATLGAVALAAALAFPVAAHSTPTGSFTLSSGPYLEGGSLTITVDTKSATRNDEVTVGVWCFLPDGSQIDFGSQPPHSPTIVEFNAFGQPRAPYAMDLPVTGTGYVCTAQLVVIYWFKGTPVQGWTLDTQTFVVLQA